MSILGKFLVFFIIYIPPTMALAWSIKPDQFHPQQWIKFCKELQKSGKSAAAMKEEVQSKLTDLIPEDLSVNQEFNLITKLDSLLRIYAFQDYEKPYASCLFAVPERILQRRIHLSPPYSDVSANWVMKTTIYNPLKLLIVPYLNRVSDIETHLDEQLQEIQRSLSEHRSCESLALKVAEKLNERFLKVNKNKTPKQEDLEKKLAALSLESCMGKIRSPQNTHELTKPLAH